MLIMELATIAKKVVDPKVFPVGRKKSLALQSAMEVNHVLILLTVILSTVMHPRNG